LRFWISGILGDMRGALKQVKSVPPKEDQRKRGDGDEGSNPERQGPKPNLPEAPVAPTGGEGKQPPPESIPGDEGKVPNPKR
jgi:hypothetical protein